MSQVVGTDIDGRELRMGDLVVAVPAARLKPQFYNRLFQVIGPHAKSDALLPQDAPHAELNGGFAGPCWAMRKIDPKSGRLVPADEAFQADLRAWLKTPVKGVRHDA